MPIYIDAEKLEKDGWWASRAYQQDTTTNVYETKKLTDFPTVDVPERNVEKLTDREQRIFLAAMGREEKFCKEADTETPTGSYENSLVRVCREIERKVKKALWTN